MFLSCFPSEQKLEKCVNIATFPRRDSTLLNQLSEYANSILKIEVEKSGLEDKIKIGSLSTIQLETERHIDEIFGSRSSVGVDHQYMREPKGGQNIPKLVQSLRNDGISI